MTTAFLAALAFMLPSLDAQAPPPLGAPVGNWTITDPTTSADATNQFASSFTLTSSGANCAPVFSNNSGFQFTHNYTYGWNQSDQKAKLTFQSVSITANGQAQGQRIPVGLNFTSLGMGDAIGAYAYVTQSGGVNASGDEGTSALSLSVSQGGFGRAKITKVFQAPINATTVAAITPQTGVQVVQVGSTLDATGVPAIAVGQWVIVDPQPYDDPRQEAVQVTAFTATSISGVFRRAHVAGTSIIGAVVLNLQCGAGQGRLLVNLSQPSYATGTASAGGSTATGVGTTWQSAGLAGATPLNLGAISFAADDVTDPPFAASAGRLRDWYPIVSLQNDTSGHFLHRSQVGKPAYSGLAGAPGPYEIRPAAIVMALSPTDNPEAGKVVLSANSFTWAVGDLCECVLSPDIDCTPLMMRTAMYSRGGTFPAAFHHTNTGNQTLQNGILFNGDMNGSNPAYNYGATFGGTQTGIKIVNPGTQAFYLSGDNAGITWAPSHGGFSIQPDTANKGLKIVSNGVTALWIDNQGGVHIPGGVKP